MKKYAFYIIILISFVVLIVIKVYEDLPINIEQYFPPSHHAEEIDYSEFAPHFPNIDISALDQLEDFPSPQFKAQHQLLPNFLWMDPRYLGNFAQPKCNLRECVKLSTKIQAELATYWNYYFLVNSNLKAFNSYKDTNSFTGAWVKYANEHTHIPIAAISFWVQVQPNKISPACTSKLACVVNKELPDCCYIHDKNGKIVSGHYLSPIAPPSELKCDFTTQSAYIDTLLSALKRPLQMINDNGEVFKRYDDDLLAQDARILREKNKYAHLNWNEFQSMKRLEKEIAFRNSFMLKPALASCLYTQYAIDGQNNYRHDYKTVRKINSIINHQYYATPDFYPRYPYNWKKWQGPWHGLKWLSLSRKTEIALGDHLFSPFVAAGWDSVEVNNIRPAQWLGLLKILGAMGAEYYYSGFFNTTKSIAKPENYIWQAAMPAYAQAVTSFYEPILRNGKLNDLEEMIQYPAKDVPVVIRKSNHSKTWVIACTWQTGSNYNKNVAESKNVKINLGHKNINVKARRQGSVYVYSEDNHQTVFYQIDGWHQYMHPYHWNKNIILEAELYAKKIKTESVEEDDFTSFVSYAIVDSIIKIPFSFHGKSKKLKRITLWVNHQLNVKNLEILLDKQIIPLQDFEEIKEGNYTKYIIPIDVQNIVLKNDPHQISICIKQQMLMLDKIVIE